MANIDFKSKNIGIDVSSKATNKVNLDTCSIVFNFKIMLAEMIDIIVG